MKFYTNVKTCNIGHFQCEQQAWEGLSKIFRVAWSFFQNEIFPWRSFNVKELSHCVQLFRYQKNQNTNDVHCILLKRSRMAVPLHSLQFFFFFIMALLFNVMSSNNNIYSSTFRSHLYVLISQAVFSTYILVTFIPGIHKSQILFHKNHIMNVLIISLMKRPQCCQEGLVMVVFYINSSWPETLVWFPVYCWFSLNDCLYM